MQLLNFKYSMFSCCNIQYFHKLGHCLNGLNFLPIQFKRWLIKNQIVNFIFNHKVK